MTTLTRHLLNFFVLVTVCVSPAVPQVQAAPDEVVDWNEVPAREIHQRLWEAKASLMADRDFFQAMASRETASTQTNYDVTWYDIAIRIDDTTEMIHGRVEMAARATAAAVSAVEVDLFDDMTIDSIVAPSGPLSYSRASHVVTVDLGAAYATGQEFSFAIYYYGHPTEGGFQGFSFGTNSLGQPIISSLSEPYFARTWWPCKDRPDDKADSFDIAIEVDTSFYVGSNGTLDSVIANPGASRTFFYSVRYPMVTYLFSVAVSPYVVWYDEWIYNAGQDTMPIVHAVYPNWLSYSEAAFDITPTALSILSDVYGQYPFTNEKYGHALFNWGGAMEHQTMSSMSASSFGLSEPVIVHELSHQWCGDMITCASWHDIWLNEGWASYSEALYYEALGGWADYIDYMMGMDYTGGGTLWVQDTTDLWEIFSARSYDKGAWVVHMLRGVLGDSLFFHCTDAYYNSQYRHGSLTSEQFEEVFEAASGMDLGWFFEQWLHGQYRPSYRWAYMTELDPAGGYTMYLTVEQTQTSAPRVFEMPVDIYFASLDDTLMFDVDDRNSRFTIHVPVQATGAEFDPANWIMKTAERVSWNMNMITPKEGLADGSQYDAYSDTIEWRGGSYYKNWAVIDGSLPPGLTLNTDGTITGMPVDSGLFEFLVYVSDNGTGYYDQGWFQIYIESNPAIPGDVDRDGTVNVADLTALVDYLFKGGPPPPVPSTGDVDASCAINVSDITYLAGYLFQAGPEPQAGCVE